MTHQLAIDFGTSNTVVAAWNAVTGRVETVRLPALSRPPAEGIPATVPTVLYVEDARSGAVLAGAEVGDRGGEGVLDPRLFTGFKRAIAADVTGFVPRLDGLEIGPREAGALFLKRLLADLAAAGHPIEELALTVPVQAFERYLDWLSSVVREVGATRVRLLDESTAAALGYDALMPGTPVLVVDFGGGTLDVSLVRTPDVNEAGIALRAEGPTPMDRARVAQVIAKSGQVIGGEDIDHWLIDDFLARHGRVRHELGDDVAPLKTLVELAKIRLSDEQAAEVAFFDPGAARTFKTVYTRTDLEDILERQDFFVRIQSTIDTVLRQAETKGVTRADIAQVLLVGGTTLIPAVQRAVRQNFSRDRVKVHLPFEAVAHGAIQALRGVAVDDFLFHGYGIRYWDVRAQRHQYEPIFAPGQAYPTAEPVEIVLRASQLNQPAIELIIGEMELAQTGASEVVFDGTRIVTTRVGTAAPRVVPLNDTAAARTIAKLEPPGHPGVDRVRVLFRVDAARRLCLTVTDLVTGVMLLDDAPVVQLR